VLLSAMLPTVKRLLADMHAPRASLVVVGRGLDA
jgi:hypothetical protein